MAYILTATGVARDGAFIPADPANMDWQAYQAWCAAGNTAAPPPAPDAAALALHAKITWAAVLAAGRVFNVAASGASPVNVLCDGTNDTRADLALLALYGQANPTGTKTWIDDNGVETVLTGAELVTLATLAGDWVSNSYPALATLLAAIAATPPTVTSLAQIDAYAWPPA